MVCALATYLPHFAHISPLFAHAELLVSPLFTMVKCAAPKAPKAPKARKALPASAGAFTLAGTVDSDVLPFTLLQHKWVLYEGLGSARGLGECLRGALPTFFLEN